MSSVLQPWVEKIPIRMQSTLVLGLRGPDTHCCPNVKKICRWLRGLTFKPGNPDNVKEFMGDAPMRIMEKSDTAKELEFCSQHFYSHLMHSLEVVAYNHSDGNVRRHAYYLFYDMCSLMHLLAETSTEFSHRLRDLDWPKGQPNDYQEACAQLVEDKAVGAAE